MSSHSNSSNHSGTLRDSTVNNNNSLDRTRRLSRPTLDTLLATLSDSDTATTLSIQSDNTSANHSITSETAAPTFSATQVPYNNPRYLGSIPFYYPNRITTAPVQPILNPYFNLGSAPLTAVPPDPLIMEPDSNPPRTRRFHQTTLNNGCWDDFQQTCDILQSNEPWGDEITVKNSNTVRIYFQNLNSCGLSQGTAKWAQILSSMITAECDILNFVQTSANWKILISETT